MTAHDDRRAAYEERAARLYPDNDTTYGPYAVQEAYVDGALYSNPGVPRVISTRDELADLDRETLVAPAYQFRAGWHPFAQRNCYLAADAHRLDLTWSGPVVVIATGDQVRAARDALSAAKGGNQ